MGGVEQGRQHPSRVLRGEGADVGIKQANHLGLTGGNPKPLPNSPTLARWAHHLEIELLQRSEQLLHRRPIGPVHPHGEGHIGEERLRLQHLFSRSSREGDDQLLQAIELAQHLTDQPQCRPAEFLHQTGDQQACRPLLQSPTQQARRISVGAVVMDAGDGPLLEIHSIVRATTAMSSFLHTV